MKLCSLKTCTHMHTHCPSHNFLSEASSKDSDTFSMPHHHCWCSESIMYHISALCQVPCCHSMCLCVSTWLHVFTGLLSRSACGVEHPLKLSCTQRNDGTWYLTLGNGEARTAIVETESQARRTEDFVLKKQQVKGRIKGVQKEGVRDENGMRTYNMRCTCYLKTHKHWWITHTVITHHLLMLSLISIVFIFQSMMFWIFQKEMSKSFQIWDISLTSLWDMDMKCLCEYVVVGVEWWLNSQV